jgi:hypothetical protein
MIKFRVLPVPLAHVLILLLCTPSAHTISDSDALIGWMGESRQEDAFGARTESHSRRWIETLSWQPRAFLYHNFLTSEEADALIVQAAPGMKRSTVVGGRTDSVVDEIRTSYGTFLNRLSSPAVEILEKKLANWTQLPVVHQEDVQVRSCTAACTFVYRVILLPTCESVARHASFADSTLRERAEVWIPL